MELYLLRHGIAEDRAASGRDADRRLTDDGNKKLRKILDARPHSRRRAHADPLKPPDTRALETAEIAARELGYHSEIVRTDRARARFHALRRMVRNPRASR